MLTLEKAGGSGRPRCTRTSDLVQKVEDFIEQDPRLSTRDLAEVWNVDKNSIHRILIEDLEMKN